MSSFRKSVAICKGLNDPLEGEREAKERMLRLRSISRDHASGKTINHGKLQKSIDLSSDSDIMPV